jgi:hypothetical protein
LRMTDYRLIFEPEERTPSHVRLMINSGLFEIPLLAMSKFKTSIKNNNTEHFYLHIVCKDVRTFVFKIATDAQTTVRVGVFACGGGVRVVLAIVLFGHCRHYFTTTVCSTAWLFSQPLFANHFLLTTSC